MKRLLATAAVFVTLASPLQAHASDNELPPDKGAAAIVMYGALCNPDEIPENIQNMLVIYNKTRHDEVLAEMKNIFKDIYSAGKSLDQKTAENMWCGFMRPRLLENFRKWASPPEPVNVPMQPLPPPPPPAEPHPQAKLPTAPPTIPPGQLGPLSDRLAQINQLARQSLPVIIRHCGSDAVCRKENTAAMYELVAKETAIAKALRNPTTNATATQQNDTVNACKVMWASSEDFAALMQCINDAISPPVSNKPVS